MGDDLSRIQRNALAWVISMAIVILVAVMGFTIREIADMQKRMPKEYVLLEQYRCDQKRVAEMDRKIDTLLMRSK